MVLQVEVGARWFALNGALSRGMENLSRRGEMGSAVTVPFCLIAVLCRLGVEKHSGSASGVT